MGTENPAETRAWVGADVPPEQAHEWIAARIAPIPADEPGIVSDADLLRATESEDIDEQKARTLAAQPVVTIASSEALSHAAQLMFERDVSHLMVLESRSARPIGVLSTLDVARALAGFPEHHPAFR